MSHRDEMDLLFLGSGNAFGAEGRAFSSFLLNGTHLFDCGPTVLQQLKRSGVSSGQVDAVFISHFHGDHFFGLPFLFLDAWREGRTTDLWISGPPGIEERAETLLELSFPKLPGNLNAFKRRYVEIEDGFQGELSGIPFETAEVDHVPALRCFAYRAAVGKRALAYSGDSKMCPGLMRLVPDSDVLVLECSCGFDPVHMCPEDILEVRRQASPEAKIVVTHLDMSPREGFPGLMAATDLAHYRL